MWWLFGNIVSFFKNVEFIIGNLEKNNVKIVVIIVNVDSLSS